MSRLTTILVLLLTVAVPMLAAEREKAAKARAVPRQFQLPKEITLTAEQQKKLDELVATFKPKLEAIEKQRDTILTEEQKKAQSEARKAAAGKGYREAQKAAEEAMKLKPEQKTKLDAISKESRQLGKEIRTKVEELLTPEQKDQWKKADQKRREAAKK
jgi:hypothetical protein